MLDDPDETPTELEVLLEIYRAVKSIRWILLGVFIYAPLIALVLSAIAQAD